MKVEPRLHLGYPRHVAKKRRKDRHAAQRENAVSKGDPASLRALFDRNPAAGARAIAEVARATGADHDALDPLLADALGALRDRGELALALELATAGARRTPLLRLEEALAAFAVGDDARTKELAALDPAVSRVVAPLITAVGGGRFPPVKKPGPLLADVIGLARATHSVRGGKLAAARDALVLSAAHEDRLGPLEHRLAAELDLGSLSEAQCAAHAERLLGSSLCAGAAGDALARLVARRAPTVRLRGKTAEAEANLARARLASAPRPTTPLQFAALAFANGPEIFEPEDRAAALLYGAYGALSKDPRRAASGSDGARAAGADGGESARARFLAMHAPNENGESTFAPAERVRALRNLRDALLRSDGATALPADSVARFTIIAAAEHTVQTLCEDTEDLKSLTDGIAILQELVGDGGDDGTTFYLAMGGAIAAMTSRVPDPARAADLAERATVLRPKEVAPWDLLIEASRRLGRPTLQLAEQAARATSYEDFQREAAEQRRALGLPLPADAAPGDLASELLHMFRAGRWRGEGYPETIAEARLRLPVRARGLVDAAAVAILLVLGDRRKALATAARLLSDEQLTEGGADDILATLGHHDLERAEALELLAHVGKEANGAALPVVASAVAAALPEVRKSVALLYAPNLSRRALARITSPRDVEDLYDDVHDALHPAFCMSAIGAPPRGDHEEKMADIREVIEKTPPRELERMIRSAPYEAQRMLRQMVSEMAREKKP